MKTASRAVSRYQTSRQGALRPGASQTLVCHYARGKVRAAFLSLSSTPSAPAGGCSARKKQVVRLNKKVRGHQPSWDKSAADSP